MNEKKLVSAHTETNPVLMKNLYRTYFAERYKTAKAGMTAVAVLLFVAAMALYYNNFGLIYPALCVWIGAVLLVYPMNMYRRQYKKVKDTRVTTYFDFYEDSMTERSNGKSESFRYADIEKTLETNQYFYIFHTHDTVSVLEKKDISQGNEDDLRTILKAKTRYKAKK